MVKEFVKLWVIPLMALLWCDGYNIFITHMLFFSLFMHRYQVNLFIYLIPSNKYPGHILRIWECLISSGINYTGAFFKKLLIQLLSCVWLMFPFVSTFFQDISLAYKYIQRLIVSLIFMDFSVFLTLIWDGGSIWKRK